MGHVMRCTKQPDGTWNYTCSCARLKKDGLKAKSSAAAIHKAHVNSVHALKLAVK